MDSQHSKFDSLVYLSNFDGPILFTSPHSKRLMRKNHEGDATVHKRERYAACIALEMARKCAVQGYSNSSFMLWNWPSTAQEQHEDPNYLHESMLKESPFHQFVHAWSLKHQLSPLFHIDIHGKKDEQGKCEIELGTKAMSRLKANSRIYQQIYQHFDLEGSTKLQDWDFGSNKCVFNSKNPHFKGSWGKDIVTMADQTAKLGVISMQVQIPLKVRIELFSDDKFMSQFASCFSQFYNDVVIKHFKKPAYKGISTKLAAKCVETVHSEQLQLVMEICRQRETAKQ